MSDEIKNLVNRLSIAEDENRVEGMSQNADEFAEAFRAIEQQAARIAELEQQVSMLRTGDTCARMCEGTAYRIGERQAKARIAELVAARTAYASEFPLNADGEPDVGNVHANIRAVKKDAERWNWMLANHRDDMFAELMASEWADEIDKRIAAEKEVQ